MLSVIWKHVGPASIGFEFTHETPRDQGECRGMLFGSLGGDWTL